MIVGIPSAAARMVKCRCYRGVMTEVAWTAIGLLAATLFGSLFWLGSRIDNLASRVESGFGRIDARLDAINARLDSHLRSHA